VGLRTKEQGVLTVGQLLGYEQVGWGQLGDVLFLLAATSAASAGDEVTLGQAKDVVSRVRKQSPVSAAGVLDWLQVTVLGEPGDGAANQLAHELGAEWGAFMSATLTATLPSTYPGVLAWCSDVIALTAARDQLARELDFGTTKFGGEEAAWGEVTEQYSAFDQSLATGIVDDPPEITVKSLIKRFEIKDGSDRARRIARRLETLKGTSVRAADIAERLGGRLDAPIPPDHRDGGPHVALLATIVDALTLTPEAIDGRVESLVAACPTTSPALVEELACLTANWGRQSRLRTQLVAQAWDRLARIEQQRRQLRESGDQTEIDLALMAGRLSDAEAAVEQLRRMQSDADRATGLRQELADLRDAVSRLLDEDSDLAQELASSEPVTDPEALGAIRDDALGRLRAALTIMVEEMIVWLERAELPLVAADIRSQVRELEDAEHIDEITQVFEQIEGRYLGSRSDVADRVLWAIRELQSQVRSARDQGQEVSATLESLLRDATDAAGRDPLAARPLLERARQQVEFQLAREWKSQEGEDALVRHIIDFVSERVRFDDVDIRRLHVALKTKPFVVLAGLTGSGKSTIVRLFAEALNATAENGRFVRVAVRPNWLDETEVLGYLNPVSNRFEPGWLANLIVTCQRQPDLPVFCLLDEMNLAPVEHYLADVLSAMEEARTSERQPLISLYAPSAAPANGADWPASLELPANLFLVGTVNIDESTRALSDRVLDRANVIQLSVGISADHHTLSRGSRVEQRWNVRMVDWREICSPVPTDSHHDFLAEVADLFIDMRIGLGMRNHIEMERFLANARGVLDDELALDVALLQRVLPKVRGFRRDLGEGLRKFADLLDDVGADRCARVVEDWLDDRIGDDTFIDGTDHRLGLIASA
jgi:energy-coupling factor transporter ATP-binding protein EcfA2